MKKIGIADTTFARVNMGKIAIDEIKSNITNFKLFRYTVPGIKDLPVACKRLFDINDCDIIIALGMPGSKPIDKQCAHESSIGLINTQLLCNRHIIEVFIHEDEANSEKELAWLVENRVREHVLNVIDLLFYPDNLIKKAGKGLREGFKDAGALNE